MKKSSIVIFATSISTFRFLHDVCQNIILKRIFQRICFFLEKKVNMTVPLTISKSFDATNKVITLVCM